MSTTFLISWLRNCIYYKVRKDFLLTEIPQFGGYEVIILVRVSEQSTCVSSCSSSG